MLKLSILGIALSTATLILTASTEAETPMVTDAERPSFEETYIDPQLLKLENCEAAEIDVMFEGEFITYHASEYLAGSLEIAQICGEVNLTIIPTQTGYVSGDDEMLQSAQVRELAEVLEAHSHIADIAEPVVLEDDQTLVLNGMAATVRITPVTSNS